MGNQEKSDELEKKYGEWLDSKLKPEDINFPTELLFLLLLGEITEDKFDVKTTQDVEFFRSIFVDKILNLLYNNKEFKDLVENIYKPE